MHDLASLHKAQNFQHSAGGRGSRGSAGHARDAARGGYARRRAHALLHLEAGHSTATLLRVAGDRSGQKLRVDFEARLLSCLAY